jgi:glyoxylase-like metal-dependent hydrolase (beta-lactamase superfamily II)
MNAAGETVVERPRRPRASAALDYPVSPPAADGSVVEVAPGVLWARMPMPMSPDHINVWLLRGDTGWTLVDTGLPTAEVQALWERITEQHLQGLPVEALVCTHFHYDHAGQAPWITQRFGVPLYMTLGEFMTMRLLGGPLPDPAPPELLLHYRHAGVPADRLERIFTALRTDPFCRRARARTAGCAKAMCWPSGRGAGRC